jgi:hypothetical protein
MAIDFKNASLVALNQTSQWLGNDLARYRVLKNYQIQGYVLDLANQSGVLGVLTGISGFVASAEDYTAISLNSVNVGSGRILSLEFAPSNDQWVQTSEYTATVEVIETGDLSSLSGGFYSGLDFANYERIQNISEEFSYNKQEGKNGYTHNVSLQLISGTDGQNPITLAKTIALNLFSKTNLSGLIGDYGNLPYRKFYTESYNQETNQCSWNESLDFGDVSGRDRKSVV